MPSGPTVYSLHCRINVSVCCGHLAYLNDFAMIYLHSNTCMTLYETQFIYIFCMASLVYCWFFGGFFVLCIKLQHGLS